MTIVTLPAAVAYGWLLTPFLSAAPVARFDRARAVVARHLRLCLTTGWLGLGWLGLAGLPWGAMSLDTAPGEVVFFVGGPLGGLSIWSRSSGDDGPGDDPPPDDGGDPPEWDWERFERDLADYQTRRSAPRP